MAMEELDLPQSRAAALLASPSPLADVYKEFADRETSYMDMVRDSIEQRPMRRWTPSGNCRSTATTPPMPANSDLDLYRASRRANIACKEAIEKAISEHYCDNVLHREAVAQVVEQFGHERILYVLAITIRQKDWDGRFSADNKQWAKTVPVAENPDAWGTDRNCYLAVNSHSGWLICLPSWRGRTQGA